MDFLPWPAARWLGGRFATSCYGGEFTRRMLDDKGHCQTDTAPALEPETVARSPITAARPGIRRRGRARYGRPAPRRPSAPSPQRRRTKRNAAPHGRAGRRRAASASGRIRPSGALVPTRCLSRPACLRQPLHRGAHAAALRVAHQRRQVGRARHSDPHRMLDAEIAQPHDPVEHRRGVEAELRDDMDREAGLLGRLDLGRRAPAASTSGEMRGWPPDSRRCRSR